MYPYEITPVDPKVNKELMANFLGERNGFCQIGPKKYLMPMKFATQAEGIFNMPLRSDDIWISTFPRSGTTWCQEMVWLINNNLDYEYSYKTNLLLRFPFVEFNTLFSDQYFEEVLQMNDYSDKAKEYKSEIEGSKYSCLENLPSPRHIKTHLPFSLLPPNLLDTCKVVYVARNPLDAAVSFYHHNRLLKLHGYNGNFEKYWDYFEKGLIIYTPYWENIIEAWELRNHPNMLFLFYEDLIADLPKAIRQVSRFLNKSLTEEQITKLAAHLHIDNFRKLMNTNDRKMKGLQREGEPGFIRKGKVGDNPEFSEDLRKRAKKWVEENLAKTDLKFPSNWKI